ncbi:unnamed protein product [Paramecium sonneborni]|uniref:Uncharacterized protein n=1 Tax=Paramecium sonneborni TaxID=65129 RepID=A0A8S1R4Z3_9CILI|nr:unnamed protein product [Paramecium sonneborni]
MNLMHLNQKSNQADFFIDIKKKSMICKFPIQTLQSVG